MSLIKIQAIYRKLELRFECKSVQEKQIENPQDQNRRNYYFYLENYMLIMKLDFYNPILWFYTLSPSPNTVNYIQDRFDLDP